MAQLNFKWGQYQNLPAVNEKTVGTVYLTTDEQAMYVDIAANKRIRVQQIVTYATFAEFESALALKKPPYGAEFYYVADKNALLKWVSATGETENIPGAGDDNKLTGTWVQINSTYALETALSALTGRVSTAEGKIGTLEGRVATLGALADKNTVGSNDIDANAVVTAKIANSAVTTDKLNAGAVTTEKITNLAITTEKINNKAVTTLKIDDQAVTSAKLASDAVVTDKIADGNVTLAKLDSNTQTQINKIAIIEETIGGSGGSGGDSLVDRIAGLDTRVGNIEKDYLVEKDLTDAVSNLNKAIADGDKAVKAIIGGTYSNAATVADDIAAIKEAATTTNSNLATLKGRVDTIESNYVDKNDYAADKQTLTGNITKAQNAADAAQGSANSALSVLKGYSNEGAVKSAIDGVSQTVSNHGTRLGTAEGDIDKLEGIVGAGLNGTTLTAAVTGLQANVKESTETLRADINALEKTVGDGAGLATGQTLTTQVVKNTSDISGLTNSLNTLKSDIGNLSNVMNFRGAFAASLDSEGEETFANVNLTPAAVDGDVIIVGAKEYVRSNGNWIEFGDASGNANAISSLEGRMDDAEDRLDTLEGVVGDSAKGLVKAVNDIKAEQITQNTTLTNHGNDLTAIKNQLTWGSF